jgi:carnosine N-methyltransferase
VKDALLDHFSDIPMEERYGRTADPDAYLLKQTSRHNFRVLVPGAGLGRLAYDVAKLGRILSLVLFLP